jgi:uncharacterized protein Smg (DUF494 family)
MPKRDRLCGLIIGVEIEVVSLRDQDLIIDEVLILDSAPFTLDCNSNPKYYIK